MGLYSRFGGKDGVVDELYAEGFERLITAMKANPVTDDTLADLRRCATCYRETALANATHYMVMFGGAVPGFVPSDASHAIAHDAFGGLVAKVARCTDAGVLVGSPDEIAEVLWGSIHGLVMLELVGINPLAERSGRALRRVRSTPSSTGSHMADQLNQRVRTLVDAALDRVFAEPFDVRSAAELEDLMAAGPIGTGPGPAATSLGAFVAAATPLARRALAVASKSSKVATKAPLPSSKAIKIGLASLPIALRLSHHDPARHPRDPAARVLRDRASAGCRRRARPGPGALADPLPLRGARPAAEPRAARVADRRRRRPAVGAPVPRGRRRVGRAVPCAPGGRGARPAGPP